MGWVNLTHHHSSNDADNDIESHEQQPSVWKTSTSNYRDENKDQLKDRWQDIEKECLQHRKAKALDNNSVELYSYESLDTQGGRV